MNRIDETDTQRFWFYVDKKGPKIYNLDNCWIWKGQKYSNGYGGFSLNGKTNAAHRVSWQIHFGEPIPIQVNHKCDIRSCINPKHLFAGNAKLNYEDMRSKKRLNNPKVKLTPELVVQLREEYKTKPITQLELSKKYKITIYHCNRIINKRRWFDI